MNKLALVLMLLCGQAWGATYWVDLSGTGTGAANGADVSNQCAGFGDADCTPSAGDTVYACGVATAGVTLNTAGSAGNVITYNYTCPGGTAGSYSVSGATVALTFGATGNYQTHVSPTFSQTGTGSCNFFNGADNITISGATYSECGAQGISFGTTIDSDGFALTNSTFSNVDEGCVSLIDTTLAGTLSNWSITGNTFSGCNTDGNANRPSIRMTVAGGSATVIATPTISSNSFSANTAAPAVIIGYQTIPACAAGMCDTRLDLVTSPTISSNSVTSGYGGFSLKHLSGGTISSNTISGTTEASGGFVIFYSTNTVLELNSCSGLTTTTIDGGCIDIDHGNSGVIVRRNKCSDITGKAGVENSGYCIMVLDATGSQVYSNVGFRNKYGLFLGNNQGLTSPVNVEANNSFTDSAVADVWMTTVLADNVHTVKNNAFNGSDGYAVNRQGSVDQTFDYNGIYGATSGAYNGQTAGAHDVTSAPLFTGGTSPTTPDGFRLTCASPLRRAGTDVGPLQDYGNRAFFAGNPSIGAWEMASGDERCTVTSRSTITTRSTITPRTTINAR